MTEIRDFFIKENTIEEIPNESCSIIRYILEDIDAFARTTYRSVYVIDYYRKNFLYVSDNPFFLCGLTAEEVKELGYDFYINHLPPEDLNLLNEINIAGFQFLLEIPDDEKKNYILSYDFHIVNNGSKKKRLIHHQITPLRLTKNGQVWLVLCVASISSGIRSGNIMMSKNKSAEHWLYSRESRKWSKIPRPELKEIEQDVLKLSAMGFTMNDIAEEVNRSFDSVKAYRKSLFEKLGVQNISEAISFAKNHRLI